MFPLAGQAACPSAVIWGQPHHLQASKGWEVKIVPLGSSLFPGLVLPPWLVVGSLDMDWVWPHRFPICPQLLALQWSVLSEKGRVVPFFMICPPFNLLSFRLPQEASWIWPSLWLVQACFLQGCPFPENADATNFSFFPVVGQPSS